MKVMYSQSHTWYEHWGPELIPISVLDS